MIVDDAPARTYRMSAELRDDPAQVACLRDYFEDVLDQIYPLDRNRGYGYAAGPRDAQEPPGDGSGPGAARHGRSRRGSVNRAGGKVMSVEFEVEGQRIMGMNAGPHHTFNEAVSFFVGCETQQEIDDLWGRLTSDGGASSDGGAPGMAVRRRTRGLPTRGIEPRSPHV